MRTSKNFNPPSTAARDRLDAWVASLDWNRPAGRKGDKALVKEAVSSGIIDKKENADWSVAAVGPASLERMLCWKRGMKLGLVESMLRPRYGGYRHYAPFADEMTERVMEKVLAKRSFSSAVGWNQRNCWDPTRGTSFCGYVRRLTVSMAKRNWRRFTDATPLTMADISGNGDSDDDENDEDWVPKGAIKKPKVAVAVPLQLIVRPVGGSRRQALQILADHGADAALGWLKGQGLWLSTMDRPNTEDLAGWVFAPVSPQKARAFHPAVPEPPRGSHMALSEWEATWRKLWDAYWPTQIKKPSNHILAGRIRTLVDEVAAGGPTLVVWAVLGGWAAKCI